MAVRHTTATGTIHIGVTITHIAMAIIIMADAVIIPAVITAGDITVIGK